MARGPKPSRNGVRAAFARWVRDPKLSGALVVAVIGLVIIGVVNKRNSTPTHPAPTSSLTGPYSASAAPDSPSRTQRSHVTDSHGTDSHGTDSHGTALARLAILPIKGRAPMTGYSRDQFGTAWTDDNGTPGGHNGCDTRNDILRRDLVAVVLKPDSNGCAVLTGTLHDPYTGKTIAFTRGSRTSTAVQIDHVASLGDDWQTGAQQLSAQSRVDLANDPLNLLAVDGPTNEAKGDGDAATWLPPNKSYRCAYVARQIAVKAHYRLWVTPAEHDAMLRILNSCPGQPLPVD